MPVVSSRLIVSGPSATDPVAFIPVDPAARWTRTARSGQAQYSYSTDYLIDCENAIIMDMEVTNALRPAEMHVTRKMIDRVAQRNNIVLHRLSGDTAYGSAKMLDWLVNERSIVPHIPVIDKSDRKDGVFARSAFTYDADEDHYICPSGNRLKCYRIAGRSAKSKPPKDGTYRYRVRKADCQACKLKTQCCPGQPMRKVPRSIH